jgi:hypothetical protein
MKTNEERKRRADQIEGQRFQFLDPKTKELGPALPARAAVEAFATFAGYTIVTAEPNEYGVDPDFPEASQHKYIMYVGGLDYIASANSYREFAAQLTADGYLVASPPL